MGGNDWADFTAKTADLYAKFCHFVMTPSIERWEVGAAMMLLLSAAVIYAAFEIRSLKQLNPDFLTKQYSGPNPRKPSSIRRRIRALEQYRNSAIIGLLLRLTAVTITSVIVPAVLFGAFAMYYGWFFPGRTLFVAAVPPHAAIGTPSLPAVVTFVIDQILRAPSDAAELFGFQISQVNVAPHAYLADTMLVFFRFFTGIALGAVGYSSYQLTRAAITPKKDVDFWLKKLKEIEDAKPQNSAG